jgi:CspA family cold shock protein
LPTPRGRPAPRSQRQEQTLRRDHDFYPTRRRGFDDEADRLPRDFGMRPRYGDSRTPAPSGPPVDAVVKWFKPEKGFGFVTLADGSGDAFLHGSVVSRAGAATLEPGDAVTVRIASGQKGPQVTELLDVKEAEPGVEEPGTVNWFDAGKGFGFIALDSGGKDVFVHASALARSGIAALNGGQRVLVAVAAGRKGPEVAKIRLA